jgi:O-antigen ligase
MTQPLQPVLLVGDDTVTGNLMGKMTFGLLVAYVAANRLVADIYTLPVGVSLHPSEVILGLVLLAWLMWMVTAPQPLPSGVAGVLGLSLLVFLGIAPFINALGMTPHEANGAERGLIIVILFAGMFLAAYHTALNRRRAYALVGVVLAFTVLQALISIYEALTVRAFIYLGTFWQAIGLEVDPKGLRSEMDTLRQRLTGEFRAVATAPHPLVLAAIVALGIGIAVVLYLNSESKRARRVYLGAIVVLLMALGTASSRTGFLLIAVLALVIGIVQVRRVPRSLPLVAMLMLGAAAMAVVAPGTPRLILNFFTGQDTDHNTEVRVSKIAALPELLERRPAIGAGYLTSDPSVIIFDNSYFTELVELGVLGLLLLIAFILVVTFRPFGVLAIAPREEHALLLAGVLGGISLLVVSATFDVLSFDQFLPMTLLLMAIGLARSDVVRRAEREPAKTSTS